VEARVSRSLDDLLAVDIDVLVIDHRAPGTLWWCRRWSSVPSGASYAVEEGVSASDEVDLQAGRPVRRRGGAVVTRPSDGVWTPRLGTPIAMLK
jgi:hypothetical protein